MALLPRRTQGPLRPRTEPLSSDHFETEPGADSALAPPFAFDGGRDRYLECMRQRYLHNPQVRQCIIIAALRANRAPHQDVISYTGPYAEQARAIIEGTARTLREGRGRG